MAMSAHKAGAAFRSLLGLLALLVLTASATSSRAVTYVVDTLSDGTLSGDTNPGDGVCENPFGNCQWRTALEEANARVGLDVIDFSVAGTLTPGATAGPFPIITDQIVIRGQTAPGHSGLSQDLEQAPPVIYLDGNGQGGAGLIFSGSGAANSVIIALGIVDFSNGIIILSDADGIQVFACYIGVLGDGSAAGNGGNGISIESDQNVIGQFLSGGVAQDYGNVISGNAGNGILVGDSMRNRISSNRIGTSPDGTAAVPNGQHGIQLGLLLGNDVVPANLNEVGESGIGVFIGNLIAGNLGDGIRIYGSGNVVSTNRIGININGMPQGNGGVGINVSGNSNAIGIGLGPGANEVANSTVGILISGANNNVLFNRLGFADPMQGNSDAGIELSEASNTLVSANHVIFGEQSGIRVIDSGDSTVTGNLVGVVYDNGVPIPGGNQSTSGGAIDVRQSNNTEVSENVLGFYARGIVVFGNSADILNNYIGIDLLDQFIPNGLYGVSLRGTTGAQVTGNRIFRSSVGIRLASLNDPVVGSLITDNVIARNTFDAVRIGDQAIDTGGQIHLHNQVTANEMFGNGDLGIDLGDDGFTANDANDFDTGHNNLQNYPQIIDVSFSALRGASELVVTWESDADLSQATYPATAHFYLADRFAGPQGKLLLGSDTVGGQNSPRTTFLTLPAGIAGGLMTATLTDDDGNTSEFLPVIEFGDLMFADSFEGL